eukprot:Em0013g315a
MMTRRELPNAKELKADLDLSCRSVPQRPTKTRRFVTFVVIDEKLRESRLRMARGDELKEVVARRSEI